jgi:ATP-binding cassette, subfamily B, multidrug efflux pump
MEYQYHRKYRKEKLIARRVDAHLIKHLFSYLIPYKKWLILSIVLLVISKTFEAFIPLYIGKLAQKILSFSSADSATASTNTLQSVFEGCLTMIGLLACCFVIDIVNVLIKSWTGQKALLMLRTQVYKHILHLPVPVFNKNPVGRLMTRTIHDIDQIDQMFTDSLVPLLGNLVLFGCIMVGLLILDWQIALLFFGLLPFVAWILYDFRTHQRRCYELIRAVVSAMNSFLQEYLLGATIIRNFGLEKKEKKRFEEINEDHCNSYLESVQHFGFFVSSLDFLSNFSLIAAFVILTLLNSPERHFQAGTYFTFTLYAMMFFRPLIDLAERYNTLQSALAAAERVFELLDWKEEVKNDTKGAVLGDVESIVFDGVWFAYENNHWILQGLSFEVKKGESLALVGITGAGKSSVMNLLLRFDHHQKGQIKINGKEIQDYSLSSVRKQFSVVFQDPFLFSGTFKENISLFNPTMANTTIESAVDYVNMRSLVDRFPEGIDHYLIERGKSLSAGEMQLVSLARAVAQNRSVLIFDEATSNIDGGTEKAIQKALVKILKSKTTIVIAHRLTTIKDATRVVVLHNGIAAESGTHQELLAAGGIYEKLYRLQ